MSDDDPHVHLWDSGSIGCSVRDCELVNNDGLPHASHPALICDGCETVVDLLQEEDPRNG